MGMDYSVYIKARKNDKWTFLKPEIFEGRMTSRTGDVISRDGVRTRIETNCCDFMYGFCGIDETKHLGVKYFKGIEELVSDEIWDMISPRKPNNGVSEGDYKEGESLRCVSVSVMSLGDWKGGFLNLINADKPDGDDIEAMAHIYAELLRRANHLKTYEGATDDDLRVIVLLI